MLTTKDDRVGLLLFSAGQAAFYATGPNLVRDIKSNNATLYDNLAMQPSPVGKSGVLGKGLMSISVNKSTKFPNASIALAQFFTNPRSMVQFSKQVAVYPSSPSAYDDPYFSAAPSTIEDSARPLGEGHHLDLQGHRPDDPEEGRCQCGRPEGGRARAVQQGSCKRSPERRRRRGQQAHPVTGERILERVMLAFEGEGVPSWVTKRLAEAPAAGMTLFMAVNVMRLAQVRELTEAVQRAVGGGTDGPLLIAADQEGGQLNALGAEATQFAGNMALGAVDDEGLTEKVGAAIGREARALGINVVYAPVLDLASEPGNSAMGIRSFGDDPAAVARHGAAMIRGLQSAGVAASVKHFPGLGAVDQDTHYKLGVVQGSAADLDANELAPFRAGIAAGARLVMSAHVAVPALTGDPTLPATLSRTVMGGTLRDGLGFRGLTISDAFDMHALAQGAAQAVEVIAAIRAGIDLLLAAPGRPAQRRIEETLSAAAARGLFEPDELEASSARLADLRSWLAAAGTPPDLDVVGSAEHTAISRELAERALTRLDRGVDGAKGESPRRSSSPPGRGSSRSCPSRPT